MSFLFLPSISVFYVTSDSEEEKGGGGLTTIAVYVTCINRMA